MWPKYLDLTMEKGIVHEGKYWFVDIVTNVLYKYSFDEKKVEPILDIGTIMGREVKSRSYTIGAIYKQRVIIYPVAGDSIIDYDIKSRTAQVIQLDFGDIKPESDLENDFKFRSCSLVDNVLWLFPAASHHIVSFDLDTKKIDDYTDWYDALQEYDWHNMYQFGAGRFYNRSVWFPFYGANIIVEFNTDSKLVALHKIGSLTDRYSAICFHAGYLFAVECSSKQLIKVDETDELIERYDLPDEYDIDSAFMSVANGDKVSCCFIMESVGDQIVGLPCYGNSFFVFSDKNKNVMLIPKMRQEDIYISLEFYDRNLLIPSQNKGKIDVFDTFTNEVRNVIDKFTNYVDSNDYSVVVMENNNTVDDLANHLIYLNEVLAVNKASMDCTGIYEMVWRNRI